MGRSLLPSPQREPDQSWFTQVRDLGQSALRCDLAVRRPGDDRYRLGLFVDTAAYYQNRDILESDVFRPGLLRATFNPDPKQDPKHINMILPDNSGTPQLSEDIYKIEDDNLIICRGQAPGGERPATLSASRPTTCS